MILTLLNKKIVRNLTCSIFAVSLFSSCAANPEGAAAAMGALGYGVAKLAGASDRDAALIGLGAGALTWTISKKYQMDARQQAVAAERTRLALRNTPSSRRYVAVPVPKKNRVQAGPKSDLVMIDRQTGEPVNNNAYETTKFDQTRNGKVGTVGGYKAVVYNTFQGA